MRLEPASLPGEHLPSGVVGAQGAERGRVWTLPIQPADFTHFLFGVLCLCTYMQTSWDGRLSLTPAVEAFLG